MGSQMGGYGNPITVSRYVLMVLGMTYLICTHVMVVVPMILLRKNTNLNLNNRLGGEYERFYS